MKLKLIQKVTGLVVASSMLMPIMGLAQSSTSTQMGNISNMLQQIQALQSQIDALKNSQNTLKAQAATEMVAFVKTLSLGSQGDDVKALQALLAANPGIYPEGLITGYFGKATEKALKKLQKENGLDQAGRVGPKTMQLLNKLMSQNPLAFEHASSTATSTWQGKGDDDDDDDKNDRRPCAIVPPGHLIAPGWLKKNKGERPIVPPCQNLPIGIGNKLGDWKATTTPVYVVPMINTITATSTASTTAYVFWTTNKNTTSEFWYSASTPLVIASSTKLVDNAFSMSHSHNLSGLASSTTYYYMIKVSDERGNSATSTEKSFVTSSN